MILPKLPYRFKKASQDIIEFRGLNKTENYKDGNLRNSIGLSTAEYPTLTQSKPFVDQGQSNIIDMHEHNGKILTVGADGKLVFDGQYLGNIKPGRKQVATVNTKLCIFPDKVYIDLETMELLPFTEGISPANTKDAVKITSDSLRYNKDASYSTGTEEFYGDYYEGTIYRPYTYAYWDRSKVEACWDNERKVWRNLRELQQDTAVFEWIGMDIRQLAVGDIFIPSNEGNIVTAIWDGGAVVNTDLYNNEGIYCKVTDVQTEYQYAQDETTITYVAKIYTFDTYRAGDGVKLFSDVFVEGDRVDISGTPLSLYDGERIKIESINGKTNTLYFPKDTFSGALSYIETTTEISGDVTFRVQYYAYEQEDVDAEPIRVTKQAFYKAKIVDVIPAGSLLYWSDNNFISVWDRDKLKTTAKYEAEQIFSAFDWNYDMLPYTIEGAPIKVSKHIPDLDFICESENRLWGVSNKTHTIYASALGLPGEFNEFDVISTDSYAVAVASEDDFTAICAYGGGVCCFKENRLHKILGSYPAEYYMNEYEIAGVQKGSERSLCIINEVLYYKGAYGVYAYSGGVPSLVSYELGNIESAAKASVADGLNYYISLNDGVYVYDKLHGLWIKQTDLTCNAMITDGQLIYGLSNGAMFVNSGKVADSKWSAEFTPFDMQGFFKKGFAKLIISAEMGKGAVLSVHVRENNQPWRKVYNQAVTNNMLLSVPLRVGRCDRFSVKIEGKGIVKLRGISRDVIVGSER